jgi:hypothetical protein
LGRTPSPAPLYIHRFSTMKSKFQFGCCLMLLMLASAGMGRAQVINSGIQAISLNATLSDSVSVNLSSNSVSFTLAAGSATNNGSTGVTATTNWISKPGRDLTVYAYFSSAATALSDGAGDNIPSSAFLISNNGGAYAPLTSTVPFGGAGAGLQLSTVKITGTNKTGSRTDNMLFRIDLSTVPQLPAGTYTGTLNIQVQII